MGEQDLTALRNAAENYRDVVERDRDANHYVGQSEYEEALYRVVAAALVVVGVELPNGA